MNPKDMLQWWATANIQFWEIVLALAGGDDGHPDNTLLTDAWWENSA